MTTLCAKGYTTDGVPVYLWSYGNYKYEVEVKKVNFSDCHVFFSILIIPSTLEIIFSAIFFKLIS